MSNTMSMILTTIAQPLEDIDREKNAHQFHKKNKQIAE